MDVVSEQPAARPELVEAVRALHGGTEDPPAEASSPVEEVAPARTAALRQRARASFGRAARRVLRPVVHRAVPILSRQVLAEVRGTIDRDLDDLRSSLAVLESEIRATNGLTLVATRAVELGELLADGRALVEQIEAALTNQALLKDELRSYRSLLDDLGAAIAPGAGIGGVPVRFAELRERVEAVDRRVRLLAASPHGADRSAAAGGTQPPDEREVTPGGSGFDYVGFELRFRGDPDVVLAEVRRRYLELLLTQGPVLDVGCGDGSLVALLAEQGVSASGVDLDRGMVDQARARGIDVVHGDAIEHLRATPAGSLGAVCALQVVEHLALDQLIELLELARTRLRPGGVLIAETPNPTSLIVLGNSYILDPTHVWPLHPSLLGFLCERAGFRTVDYRYEAPAAAYHLPLLDPPEPEPWVETMNASLTRLNEVLFGAQDYAVIATSPGPD